MSDFANQRRDLAVLETSGGRIPQIQQSPPTALASPDHIAPWMSENASNATPSSAVATNFYNDSTDNLSQASQMSPALRPGTGLTGNTNASDSRSDPGFRDERRPSVASVTTASSTGSKSSRQGGIHKKLQTFFGDDYTGKDVSESSLPTHPKDVTTHSFARSQRDWNPSSDHTPRDSSPAPSRPKTPVPSSEVVPFLYQDSQVSQYFLCASTATVDFGIQNFANFTSI